MLRKQRKSQHLLVCNGGVARSNLGICQFKHSLGCHLGVTGSNLGICQFKHSQSEQIKSNPLELIETNCQLEKHMIINDDL